jgi:dipeptidyl aminopeptidase/acylaminoacyl peptidase
MRRFFLAALALSAFAFPAFAQAKHPFTFEDMMKLKRVGEPEVSPDGKWVIFSVVDVDLAANTKTPHIWIVPLSDSEDKSADLKSGDQKRGVPHGSPNSRDVGATERILIPDQDGDRPRWAPDGKHFAFISTKGGKSQVWIANFDGAAGKVISAWGVTSIATEAGGELWSPDGKNILFTSDVYPECDGAPVEEAACDANKVDAADKSKVKALIFDHLLYRHWNAYKEGKRSHIFVVEVPPTSNTDGALLIMHFPVPRDLTPGDYDSPVFSLGGQDDYGFSPDGQEICYTSNHDKNPAASTNNDLWIVPVSGGPAKNITAENPASDSTPLYSPDGRYIAYRAQQRPGYESDRFRLMLYDRKTGEKKNLTEDFDRWVGTFAWSPDSSEIFFAAENEGEQPLFAFDLDAGKYPAKDYVPCEFCTGSIRMLPAGPGYNDDIAVTPDKAILFTKMSAMAPNVIWRLGAGKVCSDSTLGQKRRNHKESDPGCLAARFAPELIESINHEILVETERQALESFWFTGAHTDKVEGFLVKPPNFDPSKKYPVKFLIHGGPEGAWGDDWSYRWNPELFAANGYVVIMINFRGSTGYGQKFIDAINGDWGGAPFEDLMKGLDYAEEHYGFIDKTRECALGASYGGYAINWILGHTDRFKCLVSHDGMFNAESAWGSTEELWFNDWEFKGTPYSNRAGYEKWSPHQYAKNFKTPTLVIHGQRDYRLDVSEGLQLFTTLQMEGVPSKMLYFPDEGHWVLKPQNSQLWYKTVNDWVDQWAKDQWTKK